MSGRRVRTVEPERVTIVEVIVTEISVTPSGASVTLRMQNVGIEDGNDVVVLQKFDSVAVTIPIESVALRALVESRASQGRDGSRRSGERRQPGTGRA
jgi:hypothetical protein